MSHDKFMYSTEIDLSIDDGPGINEREFVHALLKNHGDQIVCVVPFPKHPDNFFNSKIEYVFPHRRNQIRYVFFNLALLFKIWKLNRNQQYKAFIFRLGPFPLAQLILSIILPTPIILKKFSGYYLFEKKDRKWFRKISALILFPIHKAIVRRVTVADVESLSYKDWLHFKYGFPIERLHYIPNGTNIEFFSPQDKNICRDEFEFDQSIKIVGYVGALDFLRHVDDLIRCIPIVNNICPVTLVLVGDGKDKDELKELARELGLEKNVIFTGLVPYQSVPKYMNTFDAAVDLSLIPMLVNGNTHYASYSQKIPQYLSCGLPVIAWDTPDTKFLEQEEIGGLASPEDNESLAQSLIKCLTINDIESGQLKLRARAYAETHLSYDNIASYRLSFWKSALNRKT